MEKHPVRGIVAGIAGGLVASWVMNQWSAGPGTALSERLETPEEKQQLAAGSDGEDATMKTADAIVAFAEDGKRLTQGESAKAGPIVHYTFGALMGGLYGGLAEYSSIARSGFGTTFATALFIGGDLLAVPTLGLSKPLSEYPASSYANPFTAHLVYGATTELVRRLLRPIL